MLVVAFVFHFHVFHEYLGTLEADEMKPHKAISQGSDRTKRRVG